VSEIVGPVRIETGYNGYLVDIDKNIFYERKMLAFQFVFNTLKPVISAIKMHISCP